MTTNTNSGVSRSDEIRIKVLRTVDPDLLPKDFDALMQKFSLSGPETKEITALYRPFKDMQGQFVLAIDELAEADRADNRLVQQYHPHFMSREQRLAIGRLSVLLAFKGLRQCLQNMAPLLDLARAAQQAAGFPQDIDSLRMMLKLQAAQTLFLASKTFINMSWKNVLEGRDDAEISGILAPIHYAYIEAEKNSPALFKKGEEGEVVSVNLGDFAVSFRSKSGHFLVRRKITSLVASPYEFDWALTTFPAADEEIYQGDGFVVTNGSFWLDRHDGVHGFEYNEMIAQPPNGPLKSIIFSQWQK